MNETCNQNPITLKIKYDKLHVSIIYNFIYEKLLLNK